MIAKMSIRWVQELVDGGDDSGDFYMRLKPVIRKTTYITDDDKAVLKKAAVQQIKKRWRTVK